MNAAGIWRLAREAEIGVGIPVGQICFGVKPANWISGNGSEFGLSLGAFFQCRLEGILLPGLFFWGGFAIRRWRFQRRSSLRGAFGFFAHARRPRGQPKNESLHHQSMLSARATRGKRAGRLVGGIWNKL